MAEKRIKGQEVTLNIIEDGQLQGRIAAQKDAEVRFELEVLESDFLGDKTTRFDSVFKGMSIRTAGELANRTAIDLFQRIVLKAQRRVGGALTVEIVMVLVFPNGDLVLISIPDIDFTAIPVTVGGRTEFLEFTLEGKASDFQIL